MKILIVDANAEYLNTLCEVFRDKEWEAVSASDGAEGLRMMREHIPDVILSDTMMPHMDGFQFLWAVRQSSFRDIIFLLYSSTYAISAHQEFAASIGADAYIVKPLNPEEIYYDVMEFLERREFLPERKMIENEKIFLRLHNLFLTNKLAEKSSEMEKESAEYRNIVVELREMKQKERETRSFFLQQPLPTPEPMPQVPLTCPFEISDEVYAPLREINGLCDVITTEGGIADAEAFQLISQMCASLRKLGDIIEELQKYSAVSRSALIAPIRRSQVLINVVKKEYSESVGPMQTTLNKIDNLLRSFVDYANDLLKLNQITKTPFSPEPLDMTALAGEIVEGLKRSAPHRHAEVSIGKEMVVMADKVQMRLAIEHLLRNAWKFTAPKEVARIEFNRTPEEERKIFFVRDNGVGFDNASAGDLFAAFRKLHRQEDFPGNGIGLSIVKTVICRHGGSVWGEGKPGEGATFYFTLRE